MGKWSATVPGPQGIIEWTAGQIEEGANPRLIPRRSARFYHAWIESWIPRVRRWAEFRDVGLEELEAVLDEFHTYAFVPSNMDQPEGLDAVLEGLYDWADGQRVWVDPINAWAIPAELMTEVMA